MRDMVSRLLQAFSQPSSNSCPCSKNPSHGRVTHSNLTSFSWEHCAKLLFGLSILLGSSQQQFCRVCWRLGYPELTGVIKNHCIFAFAEERSRFCTHWSIPSCKLKHCSRMFTFIFLRKRERGKKKKRKKQTRTMQRESTSKRTVCSL